MNVLITGGAGFIGLNLATHLVAQGHMVTVIDNLARKPCPAALDNMARDGKLVFINKDLTESHWQDLVGKDIDIIFHLAALLGVANVRRRPEDVLRLNMDLLNQVLDFGRQCPTLRRFVFASTSEVYAGSVAAGLATFPTPETQSLVLPDLSEPRSSYMLSKLYGEAAVIHSGLPWTIVRPHNFFGPDMGMAHVIPQLGRRIWETANIQKATGQAGSIDVYSPSHQRTFCFIDDAVRMMTGLALNDGGKNTVFNIGATGPVVTMMTLAQKVRDHLGLGLGLTLNPGEDTAGSPVLRQPDTERLHAALPDLSLTNFDTALGQTLAWYLQRDFQVEDNAS